MTAKKREPAALLTAAAAVAAAAARVASDLSRPVPQRLPTPRPLRADGVGRAAMAAMATAIAISAATAAAAATAATAAMADRLQRLGCRRDADQYGNDSGRGRRVGVRG